MAIQKGIEKKGGVKKAEKVYERLGRLKEKYSSVHRYYEVNTRNYSVPKLAIKTNSLKTSLPDFIAVSIIDLMTAKSLAPFSERN